MAVSFEEFAAELRAFNAKRVVVRQLGTDLRKLLPPIRKAIKANALATLPKRGGLNAWVAAARITLSIKTSGRSAGIKVKGGRNSEGARSDLQRIDDGRVRAPTWGHRNKGAWHTQAVAPGWFTKPAADEGRLSEAADQALDKAFDEIRGG